MGVSLAEILMTIKNISAREGKAPPDVIESAYSLVSTGCLTPVSGRVEKTRKDLGLPELPKPDINHVQKIFELTGALEVLQANKSSEEGPQ